MQELLDDSSSVGDRGDDLLGKVLRLATCCGAMAEVINDRGIVVVHRTVSA